MSEKKVNDFFQTTNFFLEFKRNIYSEFVGWCNISGSREEGKSISFTVWIEKNQEEHFKISLEQKEDEFYLGFGEEKNKIKDVDELKEKIKETAEKIKRKLRLHLLFSEPNKHYYNFAHFDLCLSDQSFDKLRMELLKIFTAEEIEKIAFYHRYKRKEYLKGRLISIQIENHYIWIKSNPKWEENEYLENDKVVEYIKNRI